MHRFIRPVLIAPITIQASTNRVIAACRQEVSAARLIIIMMLAVEDLLLGETETVTNGEWSPI